MKQTFAVLFALLALPSLAQEKPIKLTPEQEARRQSALEVKAFLDKDPETLAALWSDDFIVTNPLNKLVDKQQVLAMVRSGALAFASFTRNVEYARTYGDIVILVGSEDCVWTGAMPLAGKPAHLRFTAIWKRDGLRWLQVARHANVVPQR
jgi:hypothetical protein